MAEILIAGGSGLVGGQLIATLNQAGHQVRLLSRNPGKLKGVKAYYWNPMAGEMDDDALKGVDYVINLAGAGIADKRWSPRRKDLIIQSRTQGADLFVKKIKTGFRPKAYLAASAIGYYGDRAEQVMTEESEPGRGFLSESVVAWENASQQIAATGIPTSIIRIGIVLSSKGGALAKMLPSYRFKIGTYFGNGQQIYSWIHIEDLARIFLFLIASEKTPDFINATASTPVSNKTLAEKINEAGNFGAFILPAPKLPIKLALGEMSHVVLDSAAVSNKKLLKLGFDFRWPDLLEALKDILQHKK